MRTLLACLGMLLLLAPVLADGKLTPVSMSTEDVQWNQPLTADARQFVKAPADCGTVSPAALVAEIPRHGGKLRVALDADKADARRFNRVRLDFTGTAKFTEKFSFELKSEGEADAKLYFGQFGPQDATVTLNGRDIPLKISGYASVTTMDDTITVSNFMVMLNNGLEGSGVFGEKTHAVRIFDANSNLHPGDPFPLFTLKKGFNPDDITPGDAVIVDLGDGSFTKTVMQFYGHPIMVDGAWYTVGLTKDESALDIRPYAGKLGTLHIDKPSWQAWVAGTSHIMQISGDRKPLTFPADQYQFIMYQEPAMTSDDKMPPSMLMSVFINTGCTPFAIKPGVVTKPLVGEPIIAQVKVTKHGSEYTFTLALTDAAGGEVNLQLPEGGDINKIPFAVYDAKGKIVFKDTFEHG